MINLTDNFNLNKPAHLDARVGPWESVNDATTNVPFDQREIGLTIVVDDGSGAVEYWWKEGLSNGDLELKTSGGGGGGVAWGGITGTLSNQTDLDTALTNLSNDITTIDGEITTIEGDITTIQSNITTIDGQISDIETALDGKFDNPTGTTAQYLDGVGTPTDFPTAGQSGTLVREIRNETGATLTKGTAVYISGASGNKAVVSKAIATGDTTSAQTFGIIQADIPNNQNGFVVVRGDLAGLNTSAFTEGAQLYLSSTTAGTLTMVKQYAPNHLVYIGIVTRVHVNQGSMEVAIQNGYELNELHDVSAQTPTNRDGLFFNSTSGLWESRAIAGADLPSGIDATKLANGNVSNAEFQMLDGVTSGIQTQLNSKEPTITSGTTSQFFRGDKTFQQLPKVTFPTLHFSGSALAGNFGNGVEGVIQTLSIPANTLASGDIIRLGYMYSFSGNVGTKSPRIRFGNNTTTGNSIFIPASQGASVTNIQGELFMIVTSSTNLRIWSTTSVTGFGTTTSALTNNTIDLTQPIPFSFNVSKATGTDTAILESVFIEILKP